jgi:NitT/TauT family transport system permease protein
MVSPEDVEPKEPEEAPESSSPDQAPAEETPVAADVPTTNGAIVLPPHRPARFFRIREHVPVLLRWLLAAVPFTLLVALWFWGTTGDDPATRRISTMILPSPAEVFSSLGSLWVDSALMRNILLSLTRVLAGFAVAAVVAVPLGIAMGAFSRIGAAFSLFSTALSYLPIAALVPLTIAWWGLDEKQKVGFLAIATFAYLLPMVVRHVANVDYQYVLSAYTQGATVWQVASKVLIPIALPDIVNSMRLCLGIGWTYIVLAEVVSTGEGAAGVGNMIAVFQRKGYMDRLYLTIVAIMIVGALLDRACAVLSRTLFPYRVAMEGE